MTSISCTWQPNDDFSPYKVEERQFHLSMIVWIKGGRLAAVTIEPHSITVLISDIS